MRKDSGQPIEHRHLLRQTAETAGGERGTLLVGEHHHRLGREREASLAAIVDQVRGGLAAQPLADPALVEAGRGGELGARQRRVGGGERAIEAEPIAEIDHRRDHRAAEIAEHLLDGRFELVGVDRLGRAHGEFLRSGERRTTRVRTIQSGARKYQDDRVPT